MRLLNSFLLPVFMLVLLRAYTQSCDESSLLTYEVKAQWTDPEIDFELNNHFVWYNPDCESRNTLLVHLVGTFDNPKNTTYFPVLAANNGYHVVSLKYPNGISARTPCVNSSNPECYENFRREVLEGNDYLEEITVDANNCIFNRLIKLLEYLRMNYPEENWEQYLVDGVLQWSQLAFSGHSQGGGYGPLIAKDHVLNRVIMFASPNDYSEHFSAPASWTNLPNVTPDSSFYGFANRFDDIVDFSEQYLQWNALGLASFGDTVLVNTGLQNPDDCFQANSHQLYTNLQISGLSTNHNLMVRDEDTPLGTSGQPLFVPAWRYLLGVDCLVNDNSFIPKDKVTAKLFPNPSSGEIGFQLLNHHHLLYTLSFYTLLGENILEIKGSGNQLLTIDGTLLKKGAYFYRATQNNGKLLVSGKLLVLPAH